MKKLTKTLIIALAISSLASFAKAQDLKIAIVDSQKILEQSSAVKSIRDQVSKRAEDLKSKASAKEKELKQKYTDLEGQKKALAKEAFEQKSTALAKEAEEFNKSSYMQRAGIDKAFQEGMAQVEKKITDIIQEKAKSDKLSLVFFKMSTIYSDANLDITDGILKDLNSQLSNVKVNFDQK